MITLDKQLGTFDSIFKLAVQTSEYMMQEVKFNFNGVDFIVTKRSALPTPNDVQQYVKNYQNGIVRL